VRKSPDSPLAELVDELRNEQRRRWDAGDRVAAETVLDLNPRVRDDAEHALEFIYGEILLREELGEFPTIDEYLGRFPSLSDGLVTLFEVHRAIQSGRLLEPTDGDGSDPTPRGLRLVEQPMATIGPPDLAPPFIADSVGDYELIREIARGAKGVVYEARHRRLQRVVALKMILAGQYATDEDRQRFRIEAEAVARLEHPHIVPIYEVGEWAGRQFFAMKYVPGGSLVGRVDELSKDPRAAAAVLAKIARAVHFAHQRGILHRDLKPANVLIDDEGEPYVTDFGLAKKIEADSTLTQSGQVIGTPAYMAPEQAAGKVRSLTLAADVYSLGAILYHVLTGRPPFRGESVYEMLTHVIECEPEPVRAAHFAIDRDLEAIVLKCLAKEPEGRYESAGSFADDLGRWADGERIHARPISGWELARSWLRKNFTAAWMAPVFGLLIGLLLGAYSWTKLFVDFVNVFGSAYDVLPSIPRPWPTTLHLPFLGRPAVSNVLQVLLILALSTMGLLTVLLARSKNRMADIAAGLVAGFVTGMVMFATGWGALYVQTEMRLTESTEFEYWKTFHAAWADTGSPERAELLERYPDLRALAPDDRARTMARKYYYDHTMALAGGIGKGFLFMLVLGPLLCATQALVAGTLLRRSRSRGEAALRYFEVAIPGILAIVVIPLTLFVILLAPDLARGAPPWYGVLLFFAAGAAVAAAWCRWPWWIRLVAQGTWIGLYAGHSFALEWLLAR
jgi:eukaryotic-like serine/threonine-protein kinase